MRFCLLLHKLKHLPHEEFKCLNWLLVTYRFKQCVNSIIFKHFSEQWHDYLIEVFDVARESNFQLRGSFQKLECPFRKGDNGQFAFSYIAQTFCNKTLDTLEHTNNLNAF